MVDTKTQTNPIDPRASRREARQRRLHVVSARPATIKVYAANETLREVLRHSNGTRFRDEIDQPVEWPNDTFTSRRIKDGSVLTDGPGSGDEAEADEALNAREHAAARKVKPASKPEETKPEETNHKSSRRSEPQPQPQPQPPAA